jgi:hypothetical protein
MHRREELTNNSMQLPALRAASDAGRWAPRKVSLPTTMFGLLAMRSRQSMVLTLRLVEPKFAPTKPF